MSPWIVVAIQSMTMHCDSEMILNSFFITYARSLALYGERGVDFASKQAVKVRTFT
jgi:hypothetical protein